jgi:TonB family protein
MVNSKNDMLKLPGYPGGKKAFQEFISKNVRYPREAMEAGIVGSVIVAYEINDDGVVQNPHVIKGLGYGCDEEAVRVVSLLRYDKVRNQRWRVKLNSKTTIHFKKPALSINYTVTPPSESEPGYTYTITLPGSPGQ